MNCCQRFPILVSRATYRLFKASLASLWTQKVMHIATFSLLELICKYSQRSLKEPNVILITFRAALSRKGAVSENTCLWTMRITIRTPHVCIIILNLYISLNIKAPVQSKVFIYQYIYTGKANYSDMYSTLAPSYPGIPTPGCHKALMWSSKFTYCCSIQPPYRFDILKRLAANFLN